MTLYAVIKEGWKMAETVTIETFVKAPVIKVWGYWTEPNHIKKWNKASETWHTPYAENDLRVGGRFHSRMEAVDGSQGFDFTGTYDEVELLKVIAYTLDDGRMVRITFEDTGGNTRVIQQFEPESAHPIEFQKQGWKAILNQFTAYVEKI